ncbi:MAG: hypothetical protein JOZ90_15100 [Alphaproteobacteria bacterium]|nr:hypothetical protein [Alphaproteobacteria bacterium]MBV9371463.1 hypothetical protein [Alphaproteobacteria bacterium]MBV9902400.1 hypothetical protein [Alphaproteobacteria bacterium]
MSRFIALALVVSLAAPAAALAADPPAAQQSQKYRTKKICRSETVIGSRLSGSTKCRTQAEWDAERAEARRTVERIQDFKPQVGS